jgi:protein-glutamine gamma-glutamyltransferase
MNQQTSFRRLTTFFGLFATIAACLIGLGQGSWNLPLLVGICSFLSIIYTDILGWFFLHRVLVYIAMIVGACVAIYGFLGNIQENRLMSVGNLLVYVQLPLMFQKKSKQVFEQWGVFLLLELVVAALVNDNVLYAFLLLPALAMGCAALMGLAQFSSILRHNESISESTGLWARLLHWLGKEQSITHRSSGLTLGTVVNSESQMAGANATRLPWRNGILPTAFATLFFSVSYFYVLPRLHSGTFDGDRSGWGGNKIGFNEQISLQYMGQLLQNDAPAFRLAFRNASDGSAYRPNQPPYVRSTTVFRYVDGPLHGFWEPADFPMGYPNMGAFNDLPAPIDLKSGIVATQDKVIVQITEKESFGEVVSALPPVANEGQSPFRVVRDDWRIVDPRESATMQTAQRRTYSFLTYAFRAGQDSPVLVDFSDSLDRKSTEPVSQYLGEATRFPRSLDATIPEMDRMFASAGRPLNTKIEKALYLERFFANSGEFKYSLSLTGPVDRSLDPIADFVINKKSGHCQFFASALALLLRANGTPTRLVVGFRPSEYNDYGGYFQVLQNHAHVWVEAYFTLQEAEQGGFIDKNYSAIPKWATKGIWLRLDPTPAVEGSNAGGGFRVSNMQTFDAVQDFWTEMVMNMDKSKQGAMFSLFAESSSGPYAKFWQQIQSFFAQLQSSRFIGGFLSPDRWFSARIAIAVFVLGILAVAGWRGLVWAFGRGRSDATQRKRRLLSARSRVDFYERAAKLLQKLGFKRQPHQTPREYLEASASQLRMAGIAIDDRDLSDPFYSRRFGTSQSESPEQSARIREAIALLEGAVRSKATRGTSSRSR